MAKLDTPNINVLPTETVMVRQRVKGKKAISVDVINTDLTQVLDVHVFVRATEDGQFSPTGELALTGILPGTSANYTKFIGAEIDYEFRGEASGIGLTAGLSGLILD